MADIGEPGVWTQVVRFISANSRAHTDPEVNRHKFIRVLGKHLIDNRPRAGYRPPRQRTMRLPGANQLAELVTFLVPLRRLNTRLARWARP